MFVELSFTSFNSGIVIVINSSWDSLSKLSNVWVFSEQKKFSLQIEIVAVKWSMLSHGLMGWVTSRVANLSFLKYFRQIWDAVVIFDFLLLIGLCFSCNFWVHVNDRKSSKCSSWSSITITWQQRPHFPIRHSQKHFWGTLPTSRKVTVRVTSCLIWCKAYYHLLNPL